MMIALLQVTVASTSQQYTANRKKTGKTNSLSHCSISSIRRFGTEKKIKTNET